jgi:serine/threonine protein kinase
MKSIKKEYLQDINEINKKFIESPIIQYLDYKFLIDVNLLFTTEERIYFIFNLINGEDLLTAIRVNNKVFNEEQIKFYASIIGLSIDYLHNNGVILKDLRLDNIIIDRDGYLKIPKFKMCQLFKMKSELALMKETSEFLAPEVIQYNQCFKESDWWSYGVILYQLLFGIPPFYSNDDNKTREQICYNELRFPKNGFASESAKDLLKLLLNKNYKERIGSNNGFEDIKIHKFFEDVNFDDIINKRYEPEYKPAVGSALKNKEKYVEFTYEDLINSNIILN